MKKRSQTETEEALREERGYSWEKLNSKAKRNPNRGGESAKERDRWGGE